MTSRVVPEARARNPASPSEESALPWRLYPHMADVPRGLPVEKSEVDAAFPLRELQERLSQLIVDPIRRPARG